VLARLVVEGAVEGVGEVWGGWAVLGELKFEWLMVRDNRSMPRCSQQLSARALWVLALAWHGLRRSAARRLLEWCTGRLSQRRLRWAAVAEQGHDDGGGGKQDGEAMGENISTCPSSCGDKVGLHRRTVPAVGITIAVHDDWSSSDTGEVGLGAALHRVGVGRFGACWVG
jgi:hypothetical protein